MTLVTPGIRDPDTLIPLYHRFRAAYLELILSWETYRGLFLNSDEVKRLIEVSGANFFAGVEQAYLQSILLGLCRLTDPVATGANENLTLARLIEHFEQEDRRVVLNRSLEAASDACGFARTYRNKVIAHQDLAVGQLGGSSQLPQLSVESIDAALASIDRFLCDVEEAFAGWRPVHVGGFSIGGYEILLHRLWEAEQWRLEHTAPAPKV